MTHAPPPDSAPAPDQPPHAPARLPLRRRLLFAAVLLILPLALGELVCRVLGLGRTEPVARHVSEWQRAPDGRSFWILRGEGHNREGMRDRDHEVIKPPDAFRIACLGDSVTVGHGVRRTESYPALLESFLGQLDLPIRAEVFTFATSGWSTLQEAAAYELLARKYRPDQAFLGVCLNDVAEMHNNLTEPPPALVSFLLRSSAMARWLVNASGREVHSVRELFAEPQPPAVTAGWTLVFNELARLHEMTRTDACDLRVVVFPFRFQLEPDAPPPLAQRRLAEFCRARELPSLDLLPTLAPLGPAAFVDESHLSPDGHRAVAEALIHWGLTGCEMCGLDRSTLAPDTAACPRCAWPWEP